MSASPLFPRAVRALAQGAERRIHRRVEVAAGAWLVVDERRVRAECLNISMGGAALLADIATSSGSVVRLELSLGAERRQVALSCEVVRAQRGELGLRFLALDRASLEAILSLL